MTTTMHAWQLQQFGGPEQLIRQVVDIPEAVPGSAIVRVTAAALNNTDIWTREGAYGLPGDPSALAGWRGPVDFPRIQGGDAAGVVERVGSESDSHLIGQRVLIDPALYDSDDADARPIGLIGSEADGSFADFVRVDARRVHPMNDSPLSDNELAALPVAYGTATGMLERARIGKGERVLVTGASGGVGFALVQLASARGAEVIALTSAGKSDEIQQAGAHHVILRDDNPDAIVEQLDAPLDAVADVAGGPLLSALLPRLRDGGRWVIAGAIAGALVDLDLRRLYLHNVSLIGSSMHTPQHFDRLAQDARTGAVTPKIAACFPMAELPVAQHHFATGQRVGKIVVTN